jgi:thiamine biosynthesis protein ThiS
MLDQVAQGAASIQVHINGESRTVPPSLSLDGLVGFLGFDRDRVAIEYNREIVKRRDWLSVSIQAGDKLEIVQFVGGG